MPELTAAPRMPKQIPFIIGTEACERFSFYGMRNILTAFLIDYLLTHHSPDPAVRQAMAKSYFHLFVFGVYFFPLLGGYLADRVIGKYRTIFWLSLLYCLGHVCLAVFDHNPTGFYTGLFLIALGSGGIKPCVSAMVGDQFTEGNKKLVTVVYGLFYWSINLGSFFASLLIPKLLATKGPAWAFGIPGVLMFIATFVFWLGRHRYVKQPPAVKNPHSFLRVVRSAVANRGKGPAAVKAHWLDAAKIEHPPAAIEGVKAVFRVLLVFLPIPFFWMLFDQKASTWVVQARSMDLIVGPWKFEPSQMQLINPLLVMLLIPLTSGVVYPAFRRLGYELTPLRRMTLGLALGALSYVVAGLIQVPIDEGQKMWILWQLAPYFLLTTAEILVSTTGLEFAYTQAPLEMKGTLMSFFLLTTAGANLAVALAAKLNIFSGASEFFFYAGLAMLAAVAMGLIARGYKTVDYFHQEPTVPSERALAPAVAKSA